MTFLKKIFKKTKLFIIIISIVISSVFGYSFINNDFEISKNIDIFVTLFKQLNLFYVDDINSGELIKTGIDAMLKSLDPYTNYIPESQLEDYKFMTTGQYGGIGSLIHQRGEYVYISEPYEGFPAQKAGLIAGDKIIKINGKSAKGKTSSDVSSILKGQAGTDVTLLIEREGVDEPIEKEIQRVKVKIDNIPYYGLLDDNIAYIKLTGFTQNAGKEVKDVFVELSKSNELKGVIIDLRDNGGGLLMEAVNIVNIFEKKGQFVVSTKSRIKERNRIHRTLNSPVDLNIPLVILVNKRSASASEIVAGAIQDLDRGVVIGQKTFGKGLVQNIVPLSYNSKLKITIAKYYVPSGRCIQAIDYSHNNGNLDRIPDSLKTAFKTKNQRIVYDGGGIEPDIEIELDKLSNISYSLLTKYLTFDYANNFKRKNTKIDKAKDFKITDEIYKDFVSFLSDKNYDYVTQSEKSLEILKKTSKEEKYFSDIESEFKVLENKMIHNKKDDLNNFSDEIKKILKSEIVTRYYLKKGRIESSLADDEAIFKAKEIINDSKTYKAMLDGSFLNVEKNNNSD